MRAWAPFAQFGPYDDACLRLFRWMRNYFLDLFRPYTDRLFLGLLLTSSHDSDTVGINKQEQK